MEKLPKELLGLAGEYAVASELCKQGLYSQLTLGHHKHTDILIETDTKMLRITAKAKQDKEWPAVSGLHRQDDFLILVDFTQKEALQRPDFYVLGLSDWLDVIRRAQTDNPGISIDAQNRVTYPSGFRGLNIKLDQVIEFKEKWQKITSVVAPHETA